MKMPSRTLLIAIYGLLAGGPCQAAGEAPAELPGVSLANGITEMTGVAISPLMGVSAMGAWHYFRTPEPNRGRLPWFCHPAAWGTGFGLLLLCFLKDLTGPATPTVIKKPLDAAELIENKLSALVACGAFVPFVVAQFTAGLPDPAHQAGIVGDGALLAALPPLAAKVIALPLCFAGFAVVWVVSHAVNVMILFSPFGLVDTVLKTLRLGVLTAVVAISAISPVIGAGLCLILVAVAALLAPRAFRLACFGGVMAGDALLSIVRRAPEPDGPLAGFLIHARKPGFPARIFGHVSTGADGEVHFVSRRAFVGPARSLSLGAAKTVALHRGLVFPSISGSEEDGGRPVKPHVALLPRYRPHLEAIARRLGLGGGIRDVLLVRGLKGAWSWIREAFAGGATDLKAPSR
jgi:hypothetical protein